MREIGQRFERAGRAAKGERWELASYDVNEIAEVFEDELCNAQWNSDEAVLVAQAYKTRSIPMMQRLLRAHDLPGFTHAFADASTVCNTCHRLVHKAFIEIPQELGATIPATTR